MAGLINSATEPTLKALEGLLLGSVKRRLKEKGHIATGRGLKSLESKIVSLGDGLVFQIWGEDYLIYQDRGRKPGKMPPIKPIEKWVKRKGIATGKKAKGIAFAIAVNMKKIGMHSKNKRLDLKKRNFLGEAVNDAQPKIDEKLFEVFDKNFNSIVEKFSVL